MKLRQIFWQKGSLYDLEIDPDECVKIADEFAIDFAVWACKNSYFIYGIPIKEQEQLLEKYKKEKQL